MGSRTDTEWVSLSPSLGETESSYSVFRDHAEKLTTVVGNDSPDGLQSVLDASRSLAGHTERPQALRAALCVLTDLARQCWAIRVTDDGTVEAKRPGAKRIDPLLEKARVRAQELVKRNEQLREPAVRRFVQGMERSVPFRNKQVSVFSLFRNGRELAQSLRTARELPLLQRTEAIRKTVDPYLQFVEETAVCEHTGLSLRDIWRYFRHTWANQYTSTPGRSMAFLVRDRARKYHPVMGIGAIGSSIVQIRERDAWLGWDANTFFESITQAPTADLGAWLRKIVDRAIKELFIDDLLEEQIVDPRDLREPSQNAISCLKTHAEEQRSLHHRFVASQDHRAWSGDTEGAWRKRALTHLYRSKRALSLAEMLRARRTLVELVGEHPTAESVRSLIAHREGRQTVRTVLRKAKADRVGIAMADVTVCGAVEPYRQILGGKLVSMLAASPEVILAYRDRYIQRQSEIASSKAGRPIVRPSHLVFLGTTSLYGVGSSQYNRLKMPAELLGGRQGEHLEYRRLGKSGAYGTSQFSSDTVDALVQLVEQTSNGQRVNSIFGEGVSPKLRKVREGLDVLGLPDALLQHGRQRIVYGVPLVRNLREFLLGLDEEPDYLFDLEDPEKGTRAIVGWWKERWLSNRIMSDDILARLDDHVLVRPIRHGARVVLPEAECEQGSLFDDTDF